MKKAMETSEIRQESLNQNPNLKKMGKVDVVERILSKNDKEANRLRERFKEAGVYVINIMSSPGSGKTTLLESIATLGGMEFGVIEGDLETNRDAQRLQQKGVRAHQITTGNACHLEALMVHEALEQFSIDSLEYLVIENVGNLVCPASYDLGAHLNIALLSIPEGDDKVLKYPSMFSAADMLIITKTDLLPHFDFSLERVKEDMKKLKADTEILTISSKEEGSIREVISFLQAKKRENFTSPHIFI